MAERRYKRQKRNKRERDITVLLTPPSFNLHLCASIHRSLFAINGGLQ